MKSATQKLKDLQDTVSAVEQIENKIKDSGFNWNLVFPQKNPMHVGWLVTATAAYILSLVALVYLDGGSSKLFRALFCALLLCVIWVTVCVQLRFENAYSTGIVFLAMMLVSMIAGGMISPRQGAEALLEHAGGPNTAATSASSAASTSSTSRALNAKK
jgi:predicted phage tail protein